MLKEYVIDLRGYDGKLRKLISTGLQEHSFKLGWSWTGTTSPTIAHYTNKNVLYLDVDGGIYFYADTDNAFANTLITPADFLALTPEDVQAEPKKPKFEPKQWILGRNNPAEHWTLGIYSYTDYADEYDFIHVCIGTCWAEIIPYEGNEHLCGQVGEPK